MIIPSFTLCSHEKTMTNFVATCVGCSDQHGAGKVFERVVDLTERFGFDGNFRSDNDILTKFN